MSRKPQELIIIRKKSSHPLKRAAVLMFTFSVNKRYGAFVKIACNHVTSGKALTFILAAHHRLGQLYFHATLSFASSTPNNKCLRFGLRRDYSPVEPTRRDPGAMPGRPCRRRRRECLLGSYRYIPPYCPNVLQTQKTLQLI